MDVVHHECIFEKVRMILDILYTDINGQNLCDAFPFCNRERDYRLLLYILFSTLDRILDKILREHEQATPLRLPSVEEYW